MAHFQLARHSVAAPRSAHHVHDHGQDVADDYGANCGKQFGFGCMWTKSCLREFAVLQRDDRQGDEEFERVFALEIAAFPSLLFPLK